MEEKEKKPNYNRDSKVLRTYTSDMADAIRTDEVSVIKIALAEKEKRDREAMYQKAEGTKTSKGRAIQNLVNIGPEDKVKVDINRAEWKLIEYLRKLQWGSVEITVQNGLPVIVKAAVQTTKLT